MISPQQLSKIGIGTWGIGGFAERDTSVDEGKQVDALAYMISKGMNFVEANMWYSQGYSVEILAKALKKSGKKREDLFICQAIYIKDNKTLEDANSELEQVFELFETDYVDTLQFSQGSFLRIPFEDIANWVSEVLSDKKTRYTSITNANLELLKQYHARFNNKLFSHEVAFNFEVRVNEDLGIIPYGIVNNIKTVVYQPLRRNRTAQHNWEPLVNLSKKYGKTQNQIILNWIVSKGYLPITKSENISHIDEHLAALGFTMSNEDLKLLNDSRVPNFKQQEIDWIKSGIGVSIDQVSNVFDDEYLKQNPNS